MARVDPNYEVPKKPSKYMKFQKGENQFRILSKPIMGYETRVDKKPIRTKESLLGSDEGEKHFRAFCVYNYVTNAVEILEITQKGIMNFIINITKKKGKEDPTKYDLYVDRAGEGLDTAYTVSNGDNEEDTDQIKLAKEYAKSVELEKLFDGGDPFSDPL